MTVTNTADTQYLERAKLLRDQATLAENRTDTSAYKLFGTEMTFDLREGFPLLTTKKVHLKSIIHELLWFLRGETNIEYLKQNKCRIWDEWATENGDLGPVYGAQWRRWEDTKFVDRDQVSQLEKLGYTLKGKISYESPMDNHVDPDKPYVMTKVVDQIQEIMDTLRTNPLDRRMIVTAYNPGVKPTTKLKPHQNAELGLQALPPCHMMFHFNATPMTSEERYQHVIDTRVEQLISNEKWLQQATQNINSLGSPYDQAKRFVEEDILHESINTTRDVEQIIDQVYKAPKYYLDMVMYQRSADWFLGVPFNIASYSLLLMMVAQQSGMVARNFNHKIGDYHIYENHVDVIDQQLQQPQYDLPIMKIRKAQDIYSYTINDFELIGYECGPVLKGKVAV